MSSADCCLWRVGRYRLVRPQSGLLPGPHCWDPWACLFWLLLPFCLDPGEKVGAAEAVSRTDSASRRKRHLQHCSRLTMSPCTWINKLLKAVIYAHCRRLENIRRENEKLFYFSLVIFVDILLGIFYIFPRHVYIVCDFFLMKMDSHF